MFSHDNIAVFEGNMLQFVSALDFEGDKLSVPHTVAHYVSPQVDGVSSSNEGVAEIMKSYGMDVIPVCGDQLAEEEGIEGGLGLILEHQADSEAVEFVEMVEAIKTCLQQQGWSYDGWVGEVDEPHTIH